METNFYFTDDELIFVKNAIENLQPIIIADARTNGFCVPKAINTLPILKTAPIIVLPAGEENKNIEIAQYAWQQLMNLKANKKNIIINIGGGSLSDIGAFAAATYMRGLNFINIPTTVLAMHDACYGGKNGINFNGVKNLIGTFCLPKAVYINPVFIDTLPEVQIQSGISEIIKHALIGDAKLWQQILDSKDLISICTNIESIKKSIAVKNNLVLKDPFDANERQALNFGHTIGHALESASYAAGKPLLHGQAIMFGMLTELKISEKILGTNSNIRLALEKLKLQLFGNLQCNYSFADCEKYLLLDKKNNENLNFCLLKNIAEPIVQVAVSTEIIIENW